MAISSNVLVLRVVRVEVTEMAGVHAPGFARLVWSDGSRLIVSLADGLAARARVAAGGRS